MGGELIGLGDSTALLFFCGDGDEWRVSADLEYKLMRSMAGCELGKMQNVFDIYTGK